LQEHPSYHEDFCLCFLESPQVHEEFYVGGDELGAMGGSMERPNLAPSHH